MAHQRHHHGQLSAGRHVNTESSLQVWNTWSAWPRQYQVTVRRRPPAKRVRHVAEIGTTEAGNIATAKGPRQLSVCKARVKLAGVEMLQRVRAGGSSAGCSRLQCRAGWPRSQNLGVSPLRLDGRSFALLKRCRGRCDAQKCIYTRR